MLKPNMKGLCSDQENNYIQTVQNKRTNYRSSHNLWLHVAMSLFLTEEK